MLIELGNLFLEIIKDFKIRNSDLQNNFVIISFIVENYNNNY